MAIVEMKRVTLLGMAADRDRLLRVMQRMGCVQVTPVEGEEARAYLARDRGVLEREEETLTRLRWAISQLSRYDKTKPGMFAQMPEVSEDEAQIDAEEVMGVVARAEALERMSGDLRGREARLRAQIEQIKAWKPFDIPSERIRDTASALQCAGTVSARALDDLQASLSQLPARVDVIAIERDSACVWVVAHKSERVKVMEALKNAEFAPAQFVGEGTPAEQMDALSESLRAVYAERDQIETEMAALSSSLPRLKLFHDVTAQARDRADAASQCILTGSAFLLRGWVPEPACERLEQKLRKAAKDIEIEFSDPSEDEEPPTLLHNRRAVAPFEAVISNYSLPAPRGLDPTFIMAPFFACFFGMMVSDAGYGLIMAVAIPLIIHFIKPKTGLRNIMWILAIGGGFTLFWGAMFNTWFGAGIVPILINPLEQPLEMMGLCLGMGVVHLFAGLGVGAYMNFKRGKPLDAIFDQFFWFALIAGLPMLALPMTATVGMVLAIGGAVGILLTAGRAKKNIFGRLMGGLGALYGVTSWLSDILSYMRLFGMGLATGVIGMVINMLAGLVLGKGILGTVFGVVVLIGGHLLNAAINVLGAYVHACRLQYIEFFGKFYEDSGKPFSPLEQNPRYVIVREGNEE